MKHSYKGGKVLVALGVVAAFVLSACGVDYKQSLVIDENFKGSRVIELRLPKKELAEYSKSSITDIDKVIKDNLPKEMEYSGISDLDADTHVATFTIKFDSLDDYKAKLNAILPENDKINDDELKFTYTASGFRKVLNYSDEVKVNDLFAWLTPKLVEAGIVEKDKEKQVFDSAVEAPTIKIGETTYKSDWDTQFSVNEGDKGIPYIEFEADVESFDKLSGATLRLGWNPSDTEEISGRLEKYMSGLADVKATVEKDKKSGTQWYNYKLEVTDAASASKMLGAIFGAENAKFEINKENGFKISGKLDGTTMCDYFCSPKFILNVPKSWDLAGTYPTNASDTTKTTYAFHDAEDGFESEVSLKAAVADIDITIDVASENEMTLTRVFKLPKDKNDAAVPESLKTLLKPEGSQAENTVGEEGDFYTVTSVHTTTVADSDKYFTEKEGISFDVDAFEEENTFLVSVDPGLSDLKAISEISGKATYQVNLPWGASFTTNAQMLRIVDAFDSNGTMIKSGDEVGFADAVSFAYTQGSFWGKLIGILAAVILIPLAGLLVFLNRKKLFAKKPVTASEVPAGQPVAPGTPVAPGAQPVAPATPAAPVEAPVVPEQGTATPVVESAPVSPPVETPDAEPAVTVEPQQPNYDDNDLI